MTSAGGLEEAVNGKALYVCFHHLVGFFLSQLPETSFFLYLCLYQEKYNRTGNFVDLCFFNFHSIILCSQCQMLCFVFLGNRGDYFVVPWD